MRQLSLAACAASVVFVACTTASDTTSPRTTRDGDPVARTATSTDPSHGDESAKAAESKKLATLLDRYWEESLVRNPLLATQIGDDRYNDRLPNSLSASFRAETKAFDERWSAELARVDRSKLTGQDRLSYEILERNLKLDLEGLRFPSWMIPINQFYSLPASFAQLGSGKSLQPFRNAKDYDDFLARMDGIVAQLDQSIANMREGVAAGVVQPRVVMQKVLTQLDALTVDDPEKSVYWGAIEVMPTTVAAADRARTIDAYRAKIRDRVMPSYRRLRDFVRDEYLPKCRDTFGYGSLPDGAAWYAYLVRTNTTTTLAPERIHEIGLQEVARIRGEMEDVRRQVGFTGDLHAFFRYLQDDPRFYFTKDSDLLEGYRDLQRRINALVSKEFDVAPKSDYEVRPVEAFRAESMSGAEYQAGTPDGSRPGIFYVNTFNLKAQPIFGMETLSLHEASPGHHFQISIAQEVENVPMFRRFSGYVAFEEGWALYSESIGKELGLFTDPYQWYGRLADEQLRAMRLVVDTGLHSKGWTRERAIAYMLDNSSIAESDVVSEVERYMVIPGQALGYKIGQLAITELRAEARRELGARFDLKAFHRQILIDGALPMEVLQRKLRDWIASVKARG